VWAAGFWFTLFFLPLHVLIQQAVLVGPMRERAAVATELASKNTRLEELNEQLALSNAELAKANQFQADLLGMLGHEIANPLTSVLGHSEILAEALHDDDHALALRAADAVDRNAQRVAVVLGDIITLLASESGVITASPQRVALRERLDAAVADLQDSERPPVECAPDLHVHVQPGHLDQILANLLSNAVKYGCGASRIAAKAADDSVEITVADRGRGVPEEFTDHLFERYRRDDRTSAKVPGTGLGLFISRELARANGGDVTHHNEHAHGARFVLTLPTA
jgi:signal transduction histidine kinase